MRLPSLLACSLLLTVAACQKTTPSPVDASAVSPHPAPAQSASGAPAPAPAAPSAHALGASIPPGSPLAGAAHKKWSGPHATLADICTDRCKVEEHATSGAPGIDRLASYGFGSSSFLAVHTRAGWFVEAPDLERGGPMLSHHSPRGTHLAFDTVVTDAAGLRITRTAGGSNLIGGMGNMGSSNFRKTSWLHCAAAGGAVSCTEPQAVFDESCRAPMDSHIQTCKVHASYVDPTVARLFSRAWQDAQDGRWVPQTVTLPPSHFRATLSFEPGGVARVRILAPDDAHYEVQGRWTWEGPTRVRLRYSDGRDGAGTPIDRTLRIAALDEGSLRLLEP